MEYAKSLEEVRVEIKKILDDNNCCISSEYDRDSDECDEYLIRRDIRSNEKIGIGVT